jgi:hypothetical protein
MENKFKLDDNVCLIGSENYPRMEVKGIVGDSYRCVGTNYRLIAKKQKIDKLFKESELEPWINHSGPIYLRSKSTLR